MGISRPAARLRFETRILLDHTPQAVPDLQIETDALTYPFDYGPDEAADLAPCIRPHYPDDAVVRWARRFLHPGGATETGHLLMTLCYAIREGFSYSRRQEPGTQPPALTLERRRGTCRDFALLMMEAVRALGLAARFVTGYVYVPDRDGSPNRGGGSTHAWCQVYLPGAGWVEFDPTNGIVGNRDLIRVGVARDPRQAVPLYGSYSGTRADYTGMTVQVNVTTGTGEDAPAWHSDGAAGTPSDRWRSIGAWLVATTTETPTEGNSLSCGSAPDIALPLNVRSPRQCCWS